MPNMKAFTTLLSFFFLFTGAFAQNGMAIHHFTCQMELGGGAEKFMLEELLAIDPNAHVSIDQDRIKVATSAQVGEYRVLHALQRSGVCDPTMDHLPARPKWTGEQRDLPVLLNTGFSEVDEENLKQAKQAWRIDAPDAFLEYVRVLRQNPPVPYE